jgi:hypothetical protein
MISKNTILITSIGRTGTEFFSKFFSDLIPGSISLHEPDIIKNPFLEKDKSNYIQQIKYAGVGRLFFLKLFRQWTLVNISDARFTRKMDNAEAIRKLHAQRNGFISQLPCSVYVESNLGYYGLLDLTPKVFENHKAVYIVRDGRDWVKSTLSWGEAYGKTGLRKLIAHAWPTAAQLAGDQFEATWNNLSRFEQLCWAWTRLNEYALNSIQSNPGARVFKFESIFQEKDRYQTLDELLRFTTALPGFNTDDIKKPDGWLEQKIHQSASKFPGWQDWTKEQKDFFDKTCGSLMEKLGYKY